MYKIRVCGDHGLMVLHFTKYKHHLTSFKCEGFDMQYEACSTLMTTTHSRVTSRYNK